jgi:hypothetical protein
MYQAAAERERLLSRHAEEKAQLERDFQQAQAENIRALATIRGEVADRVRRLKVRPSVRPHVCIFSPSVTAAFVFGHCCLLYFLP